ncbi:hypothetical protein ONZ51_g10366 [Trametes cubensis]|uniref:Cleavage stimulation factor subunit 2 hinge domain-containing protein n=1 Tax=Trametes cubensis TaxID=1111947 RepID=A0AAD7TJM0_9APHY|nr:hypothetical protein ONZ51_g10366 [Trametes cubensis]
MSVQVAEEQLLELLLTLKRTTPTEARTILNSQPQIAYALMAVMADIGAVKMDVVQDTLAKYGALPGAPAPGGPVATTTTVPAAPQQPPSAIPPHIQSQIPPRGGTPNYGAPPPYPPHAPAGYPGPSYGTPPPGQPGYAAAPSHVQQPPPPHIPPHAQPPPHLRMQPPHAQGPPPPAPVPPTGPRLPDAFAALPEEQRVVIMRVMQMSREEIYAMPPNERENVIKLRATLGMPT